MNNLQRLQNKEEDKYDDSNDKLKTIVVSKQNYDRLKALGFWGDTFNNVIERLLDKVEGSATRNGNITSSTSIC